MIIKIEPYANGSHANQSTTPKRIPNGWAIVPNNMKLENFPFGDVTVQEINGVMTVTSWIPGTIPEAEKPKPTNQPTTDEILNALLGVTDNE